MAPFPLRVSHGDAPNDMHPQARRPLPAQEGSFCDPSCPFVAKHFLPAVQPRPSPLDSRPFLTIPRRILWDAFATLLGRFENAKTWVNRPLGRRDASFTPSPHAKESRPPGNPVTLKAKGCHKPYRRPARFLPTLARDSRLETCHRLSPFVTAGNAQIHR